MQHAALGGRSRLHAHREIATRDAPHCVGGIGRLAAELARQQAGYHHAQAHAGNQSHQGHGQHQQSRGLEGAFGTLHAGLGHAVGMLHHLVQHFLDRARILQQLCALLGHPAVELRAVQRLPGNQLDELAHALAQRLHQGLVAFVELGARLAFEQHGLDLGHALAQLGTGLLEFGNACIALALGRGRQQAHLRAAGIQQVDVGRLRRLERAHLMVVEPSGRRADPAHLKDAERADRGAQRRDHQEGEDQLDADTKLLEPLHFSSSFMGPKKSGLALDLSAGCARS
ncbi:hypothetical protein APY03_5311 [Variovorax sp. WDL1]|nr:hypothetical protein APY03_5311 [Variovorax sp. WDL1]